MKIKSFSAKILDPLNNKAFSVFDLQIFSIPLEYSNQLVQSIEDTQLKCTKLSKEIKLIKDTFSESNNELNELLEEFDIFEFNDKKFEGL